jgi:tryptophanyl-tRNA synthetase
MRPTGRLHIGHYFGALQNWVKLQNDPDYDCFYFIADWHALTSDYADTSAIAENTLQITIDYLASGLDPAKSTLFVQSFIPEHAELHLLLSMVTPLGWLERIPTYKEQLENIKNKDLHTYGFLGYPILQAADIVLYSVPGKGLFVPVGEDQVSHVEFSRELVRRFDVLYRPLFNEKEFAALKEWQIDLILPAYLNPSETAGFDWGSATPQERSELQLRMLREQMLRDGRKNYLERVPEELRNVFQTEELLSEPSALLTLSPRIPGLDGRKMSKSYNNAILLSESDADIRAKTKVMVTDPARKRRTDPGNPDICPVYDWHKLFSPQETLEWSAQGCRTAGIGCIECKAAMADNLIKWITPVRERRLRYEQNPKHVLQLLDEGSAEARESAQQTMARVRDSIFHWPSKRASL